MDSTCMPPPSLLSVCDPALIVVVFCIHSLNRNLFNKIATSISDELNTTLPMGKYNYPSGIICWVPVVNVFRDCKYNYIVIRPGFSLGKD